MNIFVLDLDHATNARYHVDQHVTKMILEYTQILSTVSRLNGNNIGYRITHPAHPCTLWANTSLENWLWLRNLTTALHDEWQYRFNHPYDFHQSFLVASKIIPPWTLPQQGLTPFAQAMPEQYKSTCAVSAYRAYYKGEKQHLFKWTKRLPPPWLETCE